MRSIRVIGRRAFVVGTGIAACSRATNKKIVVVGAGLSGLVVAHGLKERGYDVTVLEAQDRVGGRIRTYRKNDAIVEAGALHVVPEPEMLALLRQHGVELETPPRSAPLASARLRAGTRERFDDDIPARIPLRADEEALGWEGRLKKYFGRADGLDLRGPWPPPALAKYDRMNMRDYLIEQGASEGLLADATPYGLGLETTSAAFVLREHACILAERKLMDRGGFVKGGTDVLTNAIAKKLTITLRAPVKRVERRRSGVRVMFEADGKSQSLDVERVVFAIPYPALRNIDVPLSESKRRVVNGLKMTPVTRFFAETRSRFWLERGESGAVETDLPIGNVRDESSRRPSGTGVLGAYLSGRDALAKSDLLADLDRAMPGTRDALVSTFEKRWHEDRYQGGAYAYFAPGDLTSFGEALWSPDDRMHFCGCHTSYRPGFMHGALASAQRVLREI